MIGITLLTYIVAMAIPSVRNNISSIFFIRMSTIVLFFSGILSLNSLYIQSIGSGIGIYSGYFQITFVSMYLDAFILLVSSLILIARPINLNFDLIIELKFDILLIKTLIIYFLCVRKVSEIPTNNTKFITLVIC